MDNVVELHPSPKNGDAAFMLCPCTPEGTPPLIVVEIAEPPIIVSVVCPACGEETLVYDGVLDK